MSYRRSRKLYDLTFEEFPGLEMRCTGLPIGDLLEILQLAEALGAKPDTTKIDDLFGRFASRIVSWNYEDEDGKPLEPTLETLKGEDSDFVLKLLNGWAGAIAGAPDPTKAAADGGLEGSIPMSSPAGST